MDFTYIGNQKNRDVRLASSFANGAFLTANSAADFANGAFDRANAAFNAANTGGSSTDSWARAQANAAFNAANSISINAASSGSLTGYVDSFTANGTGNTFTLSTTPINANITFVAVQGVLQPKSAYSLSGNVVVFDTPPPNTSFIEVTTLVGSSDDWARGKANGAYDTANAAFSAANNATDTWVRNQANNAYAQANAAFTAANNATDTWVRNQANAAFGAANSAGDFANAAFIQANSSYSSQNTTASFANASYLTANSAASFANGAFVTANSSASFANGAFDRANNSYDQANTGALFANAAFIRANSSYAAQNTTADFANAAFLKANSGFDATNSAASFANGAFDRANSSYDTANSGASFANAAFDRANSGYNTANSSGSFANGAFERANASYLSQNTTADFANASFVTANNALPKTGGTITGSLTVSQDVIVQGNLSVFGNSTTITTSQLDVGDSLIYLANNNYSSDAVDIGIIGHYDDGVDSHTGIFRDPNLKEWIFFKGYTPEVQSNNLINISHPSFAYANVYADVFKGNLIAGNITVNGYDVFTYTTNSYNKANSAGSFANGAFDRANASYLAQNTTADFANASYLAQNTTASFANGAFVVANASYAAQNTTAEFSNGAFARANSSYDTSNSAASFANGAFVVANTAYTSQNITAGFANAAFSTANAAFTAANNATDTWVRNQANNAYNTANSGASFANAAFDRANAAFLVANTGGSGSSITGYVDSFTANGTTTAFNLGVTPADANVTIVAVQGVLQPKSSYNISSNVITFDSAPPDTSYIEVTTFSGGGGSSVTWIANIANLAYAQANAAFTAANNATDTWVRNQANNAYAQANTAIVNASIADDKAVSAGSFANGAFTTANASYLAQNTTASFANGAFDRANAAYITANSAADFANGAYATANLKFNTSGGTISGDVTITGNLSVTGNTFSTSATQIVANDTLFIMGTGNYFGDVLDIGFAGHYNDGANAHTGLIRDADTKEWLLFEGYTPEVGANNNINITDGSFKIATLNANLKSTTIIVKNIDLLPYVNNAYDKANSGASFANGAYNTANAAFTAANNATDTWVRTQANNAYNTANAAFLAANTSGGQLSANVDSFISDGSNSNFTLTVTPANKNFTMLVIDGVTQPKSAYTISGTTLALSSTAPVNAVVELTTFGGNAAAPTQTYPDILSPFMFIGI